MKNCNILLCLCGFSPPAAAGFLFCRRIWLWHCFPSLRNMRSGLFVLWLAEVLSLALFCCEFPKVSGSGSGPAFENMFWLFYFFSLESPYYYAPVIRELSFGRFEKARFLSASDSRSSYSLTCFSIVCDSLLSRSTYFRSYFADLMSPLETKSCSASFLTFPDSTWQSICSGLRLLAVLLSNFFS